MYIQRFRKIGFLMLWLGGSVLAYAQPHCLPVEYQQRNAAQIYLIGMTQVGHVPMAGNEYASARIDTRGARFQVLKVYQGNIDQLKDVENGMLEIHCNNNSALSCAVLEEKYYPFQVGQMYVVYDAPDVNGLLTLKLTACPSSWRLMADTDALADFEAFYPPVWESRAWLIEHGGLVEDDVTDADVLDGTEGAGESVEGGEGSGTHGDGSPAVAPIIDLSTPATDLPAPMMP